MICFNVMLASAKVIEDPDRGSGMFEYYLDATIQLHNLSYNKQAGVLINVDGIWRKIYTLYSHSLLTGGGNMVEVWKTRDSELLKKIDIHPEPRLKPSFSFAVFYHNLDQANWYWDNNYGHNYLVTAQ